MKTRCYCIFCPKHPKHSQRNNLGEILTGYSADKTIIGDYEHQASEVDCLNPRSDAFVMHDLDPDDFKYPITAYGDGCSETGFYYHFALTLYATCGNEEYQE